ncbi:helix-turn-helix transcriptional regulator [Pararhizobium gei]|uniref:helix-turn-helix transcriptional regulator n=1 Tax=Pararhizobium gei TaxID=1395951 RepID=UPI0023DB53A8|nr:helix-turn-helix transcriptional regulator [Rhizobium gei]
MKVSEKSSLHSDAYDDFVSGKGPSTIRTEYEVTHLMRQCAARFGFSQFMIARMPFGDHQGFAGHLVLSNWPSNTVRDYDAAVTFQGCVLIERLRRTKLPVFGQTIDLLAQPDGVALPAELLTTCIGRHAFAVLLHSTEGEAFVALLSGERREPGRQETADLYLTLVQLFEILEKTFRPAASQREKLSARETECLRWAAAGKSSDEIAIILGISVYTVSSYFKTATRKLDAVNRMQAIARAMRLKLI